MAGMPEMQEQFPAMPWMAGMPEMQEQFPAMPWRAGMPASLGHPWPPRHLGSCPAEMQEQFPAKAVGTP